MEKKHAFKHPWIVVFGISLSFFLASYDTTAFNLALSSIQRDLSLTLTQLDWVMTSMMIALGSFLIPAGKLSDRYGHKGPIIIGLLGFSTVSALGGFANSPAQLISLRILQGFFGALYWPGMQVLSMYAVTEKHRPVSVGLSQFSGALGIAVGPLVSGLVLSYFSWRWVFWTTVPISLLSMLVLVIFIPKDAFTRNKDKIDYLSAFFLCACAFSVIHSIDLIGRYGFSNSSTFSWLTISVALLWFFVLREDNIKYPLINLEILKNKQFIAGVALRSVCATSYFTFLFITGFSLQHILLLPPDKTSFYFLPLTIGLMAFSLTTGLLAKRFDIKKLMFLGLIILGIACISYGATSYFSMDFWAIAAPLALMGIGFGLVGTTNAIFILSSLPKNLLGTGSGIMVMFLMMFGSIGIVVSSIFIRTIGVSSSIANLTKSGISLTKENRTFVELAINGKIRLMDAVTQFEGQTKVAYLAMKKGFFTAMSLNLFTLGALAFLVFFIVSFMKFKKVQNKL